MNSDQRDHDLWQSVRDQGKAIISLEANQETFKESLASIAVTLKDLSATVTNSGKTQWPVIIGSIMAAMAFVGLVSGLVAYAWVGDITEVSGRLSNLDKRVQTHLEKYGHPESVIRQVQELKESTLIANQRLDERMNRMDDQMNYLERRTGVLFNKGKPY